MNTDRSVSEQEVLTPDDFLAAITRTFGPLEFDLAASDGHEILGLPHFTPEQDSLIRLWPSDKKCWLNPPYKDLRPWAEKAKWHHARTGGTVIMLCLASIGTEWFRDTFRSALVLGLSPRLQFKGHKTRYPKDLMLMIWGLPAGFNVWRWDMFGSIGAHCLPTLAIEGAP